MGGAFRCALGPLAVVAVLSGCATGERLDGSLAEKSAASSSAQANRLRGLSGHVRLVGLKAEAVDALLGPPELARNERQAQYRRYRLDGCAVDLFLYDDRSNGAAKVTWFEVRPVDPLVGLDSPACGWLQERLGRPGDGERHAAAVGS